MATASKLFCVLALIMIHAPASAEALKKSECLANHDRHIKDRCMPLRTGGSCRMSVSASEAFRVDVEVEAVVYHTSFVTPFECDGKPFDDTRKTSVENVLKNCDEARFDISFGGLNRGMIEIRSQKRLAGGPAVSVGAVEVYLNHDKTGNSYTKLTCAR